MAKQQTVLQPRTFRKALFDERGISTSEIAALVPCSDETVRRVVNDETVYDTPNSKRVKQMYAERVGMPVDELWPEGSA